MREIKFRAWNGKYMIDSAYGDWVSFDGVPYTEATHKGNTRNIEVEKAKDYILMQFTGLLDKNGKEIYEGDIINFKSDKHHPEGGFYANTRGHHPENAEVVVWENDGWHLGPYHLKETIEFNRNSLGREVIGNIYESPELLNPR